MSTSYLRAPVVFLGQRVWSCVENGVGMKLWSSGSGGAVSCGGGQDKHVLRDYPLWFSPSIFSNTIQPPGGSAEKTKLENPSKIAFGGQA